MDRVQKMSRILSTPYIFSGFFCWRGPAPARPPTETTATPPPWPRPFSAKATCWAWCCSCRRRARSPVRGSISWPRPCPPSWESTWNRENRPPEVLPPAVSISGSDSSPISFSERIAIGCAGLIGVGFHVFTKCLADNKIFQIDHLIIKRSPGNRIFCSDNAELTTLVKIGNAGLNIGLGYCFF